MGPDEAGGSGEDDGPGGPDFRHCAHGVRMPGGAELGKAAKQSFSILAVAPKLDWHGRGPFRRSAVERETKVLAEYLNWALHLW